ncbi:MAG: Ig-like domain-containing protein [Bacteroidales bacterium]|nr:Ig-like domain-containing protein [Bacteroidales bacterium]
MIKKALHIILMVMAAAALAGCGGNIIMPSPMVETIQLSQQEISVCAGETEPVSVSFAPVGSSSPVEWTSDDERIATVSIIGVVTGVAEGTVKIHAKATRNARAVAECLVNVLPERIPDVLVSSIKFAETSWELEIGDTFNLSEQITVLPEDAANKSVTWNSSKPEVATINGTGLLTAMSAGTTIIKATANDGSGVYSSCSITVKGSEQGGDDPVDPGSDPAADPKVTMFDSCDNMDNITQNPKHRTGMTVETIGRQEGKGYIQRISGTDAEIFIIGRQEAIDSKIKDKSKGHLVFYFYIDDAAKLKSKAGAGGRIEISQSGSPSLQCLYWDSQKYLANKVQDGWNYIDLPFSEGTEITPDNPFNQAGAKYFRIYFNGQAASIEFTYGLDAVGFYEDE